MTRLDDPGWKLEVHRGWHPLLDELHQAALLADPGYSVFQVKEKWGLLRVYLTPSADQLEEPDEYHRQWTALHDAADAAEVRSRDICELCGASAAARYNVGWIKTYCAECAGESAPWRR